MVALFFFLKGMTGALAPFSYLVTKRRYTECRYDLNRKLNVIVGREDIWIVPVVVEDNV
jgi:hypothetical protein